MTFLLTFVVLAMTLVGSAFLPQKIIDRNMEVSADYLCKKEVFFELGSVSSSKIDRYADAILLNIAYHFDKRNPFSSVMESRYYFLDTQNENENLRDAVKGNLPDNTQYMRYWHGSAAFVRFFHLFGSIRLMYLWHAVLMGAMIVILLVLLSKERIIPPAVSLSAALISGSIWYVPFSLEYTWTVLLMLAFAIVIVKKKDVPLELFLIAAMLTNFLDFLTTETLTLTVPLALMLYFKKGRIKKADVIYPAVTWFVGYAGMWILKWVVASVAMGESALPYVTQHVQERLGGDISVSLPAYMAGAITRNVGCLFPLEYGVFGIFAGLAITLLVGYRLYVYWKPGADKVYCYALAALAVIPFVRFLILHNHSFLHHFFTFRALIGSVLAVGLIVAEMSEKKEK